MERVIANRFCLSGLVSLLLWVVAPLTLAADMPRVPDGFEVEVVAARPLVNRPVRITLDQQGRMFVFDSSGDNLPDEELIKKRPHRILLLEDIDGDGKFDSSKVFADNFTMPMGLLWHQGALYVSAPPSLWKLEDTDGDGEADRRTVVLTGFGWTGNAASIHGPYPGPNGYLYLNTSGKPRRIQLKDGTVEEGGGVSGMYRFRMNGSDFERFCGGGMDNPCGAVFTPEGEIIAVMTFYNYPDDGSGKRDAMVHFIEGGAYPKKRPAAIPQLKFTGDWMPPLSHFGVYAPSSIAYYHGGLFGEEYVGNVFTAQFNVHRVLRHILKRDGATFRCSDEDFLVSSDTDFHPTDVLVDADGSLLVVNTGGWFRKGCPTSQIAKPDILGAIYRVRRKNAPPVKDPRGLELGLDKLPPERLVQYLDDSRPVVSDRAVTVLASSGPRAVPTLTGVLKSELAQRSGDARRNALWALSQIDSTGARAAVRAALNDSSQSVRIAAARSVGLLRDADALENLLELVVKDTPPVRRESATALGRICEAGRALPGTVSNTQVVTTLFDSLRVGVTDRFLEHALIYAVMRIASREATLPFLSDSSPDVRRSALIALDQMDGGDLTRELVAPLLDTDDPQLQRAALSVISRRTGWAEEMLALVRKWLRDTELTEERTAALRGALLAQSRDIEIQKLVAEALAAHETPTAVRQLLLEVIYRSPLEELPERWLQQLGESLEGDRVAEQRQVISVLQDRAVDAYDRQLKKLADDPSRPPELRVEALVALAPRLKALDERQFVFLKGHLSAEDPPLRRLAAGRALGDAPLEDAQLARLARSLSQADPLTTPALLPAFARSSDEGLGLALVTALDGSPAAENLSADELAAVLENYPAKVQQQAGPLMRRLGVDLEKQKARLESLEPLLVGGDPDRGREVFVGKQTACSSCHTVDGQGGKVGPTLTGIGKIRSGRDLLEALVFPSASFARGFRSYVIATAGGRVHTGIITRQTADVTYLRTAQLAEIRIPRGDIEEMRESSTSIMPKGLEATLPPEDLRDLLAFLQAQQ